MNIEEQKAKLQAGNEIVAKINALQIDKKHLQDVENFLTIQLITPKAKPTIVLPTTPTQKVQDALDTLAEELIIDIDDQISDLEADFTALFA